MRIALALAALALVAGCQYDPHAHLYTTTKPDPTAVAGTYRLAEQTVAPGGPAALGEKACRIELREDGTFVASHVPPPEARRSGRDLLDGLVSGRGRWRIVGVGAVGDGRGPARTRWGVSLEPESGRMMDAGLNGQGPPYGLIFTIGDPDAGTALILEKAG